ncbi:SseB family protein [Microbacterium yannicii]|uniref:SseB family protein n=1 Tax=Microbacterium yannicii TaxID=671622 RepID=UPI00068773C7|nr:SseB family protein [Microbacterium yannicii]
MALFSRRPKKPAESLEEASRPEVAEEAPQPAAESAGSTASEAPAAPGASVDADPGSGSDAGGASTGDAPPGGTSNSEASADGAPTGDAPPAAASVPISVSTFGGLGATSPGATTTTGSQAPTNAPARPRGPRADTQVAPPASETVPGLRDNVLLRDALARMADGPQSQALLDVTRQLLQGHVFLRVKGDARSLLAEGKDLPLAVATAGDRTFALVYSSGAALQASLLADGDAGTSAMGQPVPSMLRHVLAGKYDGIIIDHASAPARAVLPKELLQKVVEQSDPQLTVKTLLAGERTPATAAAVADALTKAPLWVAVGKTAGGKPGLAEGRTPDGSRYLEVYSHPLEVAVVGRGDNAAPVTGAQLAKALSGDAALSGVVVDPAGPWIRLTRSELAPVLALAG